MAVNLDLGPYRSDLAIGADYKGGTLDPHIVFPIHRFFDPHSELFAKIGVMVGP